MLRKEAESLRILFVTNTHDMIVEVGKSTDSKDGPAIITTDTQTGFGKYLRSRFGKFLRSTTVALD